MIFSIINVSLVQVSGLAGLSGSRNFHPVAAAFAGNSLGILISVPIFLIWRQLPDDLGSLYGKS